MQAFPFTSKVDYDSNGYPQFDRAVDSLVLRKVLMQYVSNGVFPNPSTNFQVTANSETAMTVKVAPGACIINGTTGYETEDRVLTVQAADARDRIDTVVLRFNDHTDYRNIDLYIVKGTPASEPSAPELQRTNDLYELGLANIFIPANGVSITQERITDTRLNESRCGYASFFTYIDTQTFYDQIQADLAAFHSSVANGAQAWEESFEDAVHDWFDNLRRMIDENDVVAINDRLDYVERHYALGQGIEFKIAYVEGSPSLQILFDDEVWTDPSI